MFCNLGEPALEDYGAIGTEIMPPKGRILFRERWQSTGIFVVCTGKVKLTCTSRQGRVLILKIATPGDVLGFSASSRAQHMRSLLKRFNQHKSRRFREKSFSHLFIGTVRLDCRRRGRFQMTTKGLSFTPEGLRFLVRLQAGWQESCLIGVGLQHQVMRCTSLWR